MGTRKSIKKKKTYRLHCRDNTLSGMSTLPSGDWVQNNGVATANSLRDVLNGTRGKASRGARRGTHKEK
jgi:hypothetical protein